MEERAAGKLCALFVRPDTNFHANRPNGAHFEITAFSSPYPLFSSPYPTLPFLDLPGFIGTFLDMAKRPSFIPKPICRLSIALSLAFPVFATAATNNIVFLAGGRSHGPGEHEFNAGCQILAKALNEQSGL